MGAKVHSELLIGSVAEDDEAFAVNVTTANPPANILPGSKLQVTFAGNPVQERVMPARNAGLGFANIVAVADWPSLTIAVDVDALSVKSGALIGNAIG